MHSKRKGALPAEQILALHKRSHIKSLRPLTGNQIQPASMDLRLSRKCWEVEASFLPGHKKTLIDGESVKLSSFGTFTPRQKRERIGRNPKTGVAATINARRVISFKPSKLMKERINKSETN